MTIGIHQFRQSNNNSCYFIERPFGNLLVFSDDIDEIDHDLIKSKGGLFRQYFESYEGVSNLNRKNFKIYGAKGIGTWSDERFDPGIAFERFNTDFKDPSIKFIIQGASKYIILNQGAKRVAIMGTSFELGSSGEILVLGHNQTNTILSKLKVESVEIVYFTSFETESSLVFREPSFIQKIKDLIKM